MASKNFFRIRADIKKPTQKDIALVRIRTLRDIRHSRKGEGLDAKSVESLLRIASGRYSGLHSKLEAEYRNIDNQLDSRFSNGVKITRNLLVRIDQDIRQLKRLTDGEDTSGINHRGLVQRLDALIKRKSQQ